MRTHKVCTQPACILRDAGADPSVLAELIVRMLSGDDLDDAIPSHQVIVRRDCCVPCALRVMRGKRPLRTVEEIQQLAEAAKWSRRRDRRRRK